MTGICEIQSCQHEELRFGQQDVPLVENDITLAMSTSLITRDVKERNGTGNVWKYDAQIVDDRLCVYVIVCKLQLESILTNQIENHVVSNSGIRNTVGLVYQQFTQH